MKLIIKEGSSQEDIQNNVCENIQNFPLKQNMNNSSIPLDNQGSKNDLIELNKRVNSKRYNTKNLPEININQGVDQIEKSDDKGFSKCLKEHKTTITYLIIAGCFFLIVLIIVILNFSTFKINLEIEISFPNFDGDTRLFIKNSKKLNSIKIFYIKDWFDNTENISDTANFIEAISQSGIKELNTTIKSMEEGKYTFKIIAKNGWKKKTVYKEISVIRNNEIIIAALASVMPVTIITLNIQSYTNNFNIPMYVIIERRESWNFENLPTNVYKIHTYHDSDFVGNYIDLDLMYSRVSTWIDKLQKDYPKLKFIIYVSDKYSYGFLDIVYLKNLNTSNFKLYFVSTGAFCASMFNTIFDVENWSTPFEQYKEKYNKAIESIKELGVYDWNINPYKMTEGFYYPLVVMDEDKNDNFYWIVLNHKLFGANTINNDDGIYQTKILPLFDSGKISDCSLSNIFTALTDDEKSIIKSLYHFSKDVFTESINQKKDAIILLGKKTAKETYIDQYINATISFYGNDKFLYYYKGHPNDNIVIDDKKKHFEDSFNVTWLDASIPAELIYFLSNELEINGWTLHTYFTGYSSGTFNSVDGQYFRCLWDGDADRTLAKDYIDNFDFLIFPSNESNAVYGSIATQDLAGNPTCFILEYVKNKPKYTHSVYSFSTYSFKHYVYLKDGIFEQYKG